MAAASDDGKVQERVSGPCFMRVRFKTISGKRTCYYYRTEAATRSSQALQECRRFSYEFVVNSWGSVSFFLSIQEHDTLHPSWQQYLARLKMWCNIGSS